MTQYRDRRQTIDVTGGPTVIQLDSPIGKIEAVATFKGMIFKEQYHELKDLVMEQAEIVSNDDNTVMRRVSLPWVESHYTGFYAMPSSTTMRIPKGFGEGYPSKVVIVNPYKKLYEELTMEFNTETGVLTLDTDAYISADRMEHNMYFVYDADVKKLKLNVPGGKFFEDFMNTAVGSTWFLPFLNYATNTEEHKIVIGEYDRDFVTLVSEHGVDRHHIYVGHKNNYREFEPVDSRMLLKHDIDDNVHYARKNDFIAAMVSDKVTKLPKVLVVVNGGDERITTHYSKKEEIVHNGSTLVKLIDAPFGRPMPSVKEVIDMVVSSYHEADHILKDFSEAKPKPLCLSEEPMLGRKNFPMLGSLFGKKGAK